MLQLGTRDIESQSLNSVCDKVISLIIGLEPPCPVLKNLQAKGGHLWTMLLSNVKESQSKKSFV